MSDSIQAAMYEALQLREEVNAIACGFNPVNQVFSATSLGLPGLNPSELGFIRVVSWLYVHYYEVGKLGTEFLTELVSAYALEFGDRPKAHRTMIQRLRTYCQHNLAPTETHSIEIQRECESWFFANCGSKRPGVEEHWNKLLRSLICEAIEYFTYLRDTLRKIELDESKTQLIEQWALRISRFHAPHKFDRIIEEVASDFGREGLDAVRFRKRYYDRWRKEFELRLDNCDFEREARKLIEHALLSEQQNVLPIDGRDVMELLEIPPGPKIKDALLLARQIHELNPCNKEELIQQLKDRIASL